MPVNNPQERIGVFSSPIATAEVLAVIARLGWPVNRIAEANLDQPAQIVWAPPQLVIGGEPAYVYFMTDEQTSIPYLLCSGERAALNFAALREVLDVRPWQDLVLVLHAGCDDARAVQLLRGLEVAGPAWFEQTVLEVLAAAPQRGSTASVQRAAICAAECFSWPELRPVVRAVLEHGDDEEARVRAAVDLELGRWAPPRER